MKSFNQVNNLLNIMKTKFFACFKFSIFAINFFHFLFIEIIKKRKLTNKFIVIVSACFLIIIISSGNLFAFSGSHMIFDTFDCPINYGDRCINLSANIINYIGISVNFTEQFIKCFSEFNDSLPLFFMFDVTSCFNDAKKIATNEGNQKINDIEYFKFWVAIRFLEFLLAVILAVVIGSFIVWVYDKFFG